jgi:hypothetical protein
VSAAKGIVIAGKGEETLAVFENIKAVNMVGDEVLAKIIRKSNEGVMILRFTTDAGDFISHLR